MARDGADTYKIQVAKSKELVYKSVQGYAAHPSTKAFVKSYLFKANEKFRQKAIERQQTAAAAAAARQQQLLKRQGTGGVQAPAVSAASAAGGRSGRAPPKGAPPPPMQRGLSKIGTAAAPPSEM